MRRRCLCKRLPIHLDPRKKYRVDAIGVLDIDDRILVDDDKIGAATCGEQRATPIVAARNDGGDAFVQIGIRFLLVA